MPVQIVILIKVNLDKAGVKLVLDAISARFKMCTQVFSIY